MADSYRDFVPAGEDAGALGNKFTDFVPEHKPQPVKVPEETVEVKPEAVVVLKCDKCDFVAKSEFGLKAHARKHEAK